MRVVVAPDSMGGTLTAGEVAAAVAAGWALQRPDDDLVAVPMSDGGEGLLDVVARSGDREVGLEVAGPLGHPVRARLLVRDDGTAIVESALACGLALVPPDRRDPRRATTYGVGELLDDARRAGAHRILVGLGGSATVDGGAGALTGLGFRLRVADGSGLKVGAADLARVASVEPGWRDPAWGSLDVVVLSDVDTVLGDAPARFGPQKGATPAIVEELSAALRQWERVVAGHFGVPDLARRPGTGAGGGLGYALAAALGARLVGGAAAVADEVGLDGHLDGADVVITGEGRLDATSFDGKVVGEVLGRARDRGAATAVVAGRVALDAGTDAPMDDVAVEQAPADSSATARTAVAAAGTRLARRLGAH